MIYLSDVILISTRVLGRKMDADWTHAKSEFFAGISLSRRAVDAFGRTDADADRKREKWAFGMTKYNPKMEPATPLRPCVQMHLEGDKRRF
jgi:hypothetical protein